MVSRSAIVTGLYVLDIAAWCIALGGIAAWQYNCNVHNPDSILDTCLTAYAQLSWWTVFFQLFALIFLGFAYYSQRGTNKVTLMVMLAMVTTTWFVVTNNAFTVVKNSAGALQNSTQAFAAGAIITMIVNFLVMFVVGDDVGSSGMGVPSPPTYVTQNPAAVQMSHEVGADNPGTTPSAGQQNFMSYNNSPLGTFGKSPSSGGVV